MRGSFDSTRSESQSFISLAASSLPSLRRCVPMKMNGSDIAALLRGLMRVDLNGACASGRKTPILDWLAVSPTRASALAADDSKQLSWLLNTFQFGHAAFFEAKASAGDEVAHGCRNEDLTRASKGCNACSCVDGDPAHCFAHPLDLTRVSAGSEFEPKLDGSR